MSNIRSTIRNTNPPLEDFPASAVTALVYVFQDLESKFYLKEKTEIIRELNRIGRFTSIDLEEINDKSLTNAIDGRFQKLEWYDILYFCERTYEKLLSEREGYDFLIPIEEVKSYFAEEINAILEEENINFVFVDGCFLRRGSAQTRKAMEAVGFVLANKKLERAKILYNKAVKAFNSRPKPDVSNCVKDAFCALEASIEILTGKEASKNFDVAINKLTGNGTKQIPPPIAESIKKLYGYRGSGEGVGHAAINGNRVIPIDAELILSLTATYITYLCELYPLEEEIPF